MSGDLLQGFDGIKKRYDELCIRRDIKREKLAEIQETIGILQKTKENVLKARVVIQNVAQLTQKKLEKRFSQLVTLALHAVFPDDPYDFLAEFVTRRGKTECDLYFVRRGKKVDPMDCSGGGVKDVASFVCKLVFWSFKKPRPVVIADEPFKFLHSKEYQRNCSDMITMLSKRLSIQMILVTDQSDIVGDKIFNVEEMK